jgi:hypothetical protein
MRVIANLYLPLFAEARAASGLPLSLLPCFPFILPPVFPQFSVVSLSVFPEIFRMLFTQFSGIFSNMLRMLLTPSLLYLLKRLPLLWGKWVPQRKNSIMLHKVLTSKQRGYTLAK